MDPQYYYNHVDASGGQPSSHHLSWWIVGLMFLLVIGIAGFLGWVFIVPHGSVVEQTLVDIPKGTSVQRAGNILAAAGIVKYPKVFALGLRVLDMPISAGVYRFDEPASTLHVMRRLATGAYGDVSTRVVIPEGATNDQIISAVTTTFPHISADELRTLIHGKEGYLFPETYFFFPNVKPETIVATLEEQFQKVLVELEVDIQNSERSLDDVVTMASLVEKEAYNDPTEQATVAGILWKRIDEGMLLQVDATFLYFLGKTSAQVTQSDLRNESPYNTYVHTGLPPTPIGNPGKSALQATLNPIDSPYYFYLHDNNGTIHYARNHDEHVANKNKYLR